MTPTKFFEVFHDLWVLNPRALVMVQASCGHDWHKARMLGMGCRISWPPETKRDPPLAQRV